MENNGTDRTDKIVEVRYRILNREETGSLYNFPGTLNRGTCGATLHPYFRELTAPWVGQPYARYKCQRSLDRRSMAELHGGLIDPICPGKEARHCWNRRKEHRQGGSAWGGVGVGRMGAEYNGSFLQCRGVESLLLRP